MCQSLSMFFGVIFLLFSIFHVSAQDSWDPEDDIFTGATNLVPTSTGQTHGPHTLSSTDKYDWYKMDMLAGRKYILSATGEGDSWAELYNQSISSCAHDDNSNGNDQFKIEYTCIESGTYYLRVQHYYVGRDWKGHIGYSYEQIWDSCDPQDNAPEGATELAFRMTRQLHGPHTLSNTDKYDHYKITMIEGRKYVISSIGEGNTYAELYSDLTLSNLVAKDDESNGNNQFKVVYTCTKTGTYYLRVQTYYVGNYWKGHIQYGCVELE